MNTRMDALLYAQRQKLYCVSLDNVSPFEVCKYYVPRYLRVIPLLFLGYSHKHHFQMCIVVNNL